MLALLLEIYIGRLHSDLGFEFTPDVFPDATHPGIWGLGGIEPGTSLWQAGLWCLVLAFSLSPCLCT